MKTDELDAMFVAHGLPPPTAAERAAILSSTVLSILNPVPPLAVRPAPARPRHRQITGFSRTHDAACLYRELRRLHLKQADAIRAVVLLLGTSRSDILKYQNHAIEVWTELTDRNMAGFVLTKYWESMVRRKWRELAPTAKAALRNIRHVDALLRKYPPDSRSS